jgi:heme-degrading monooxygenase HmoA
MFARVARYRIPQENLDDSMKGFREAIDKLRQIDGNAGGYLLVDRDNCTAITIAFWEDRRSFEASEVQASRLRSEAVGPYGGEIQALDRCEVMLEFSDLATA